MILISTWNQLNTKINAARNHLVPPQKKAKLTKDTYLRGCWERSSNPQIPKRAILDLRQVLRDSDVHTTRLLLNTVRDLDRLLEGNGIHIAHRVIVQPHVVVVTRVLVQWVWAASRGLPVEVDTHGLAS